MGHSKKHACFLENAAWNFSWLARLGLRLNLMASEFGVGEEGSYKKRLIH